MSRVEQAFRAPARSAVAARLLPNGDAYSLLQGDDRELLVPDAAIRAALWTTRAWPGAVLVVGEVVGTWRRAQANLTIQAWRRLSRAERDEVEAKTVSLPIPGIDGRIAVRWDD
jgi:DNA glycosylase AlkZ-like